MVDTMNNPFKCFAKFACYYDYELVLYIFIGFFRNL